MNKNGDLSKEEIGIIIRKIRAAHKTQSALYQALDKKRKIPTETERVHQTAGHTLGIVSALAAIIVMIDNKSSDWFDEYMGEVKA